MTEHRFQITVSARPISVITTLTADQAAIGHFIYAPGAGSNINDLFGRFLSDKLVTSGVSLTRFQFPYMEEGKRRPDSPRLLEETWDEVIRSIRDTTNTRIVVGGRSMGGRIASQAVAKGTVVDGLALFAYPLRPPSNPLIRRDEHLPIIKAPTLLCSGTRDAFASPEELEEAASKVPRSTVHHLEGADHGFGVLKSSGRTREDVWAEATDRFMAWLLDQVVLQQS